jgi:hypothetical protein
MIPLYGFLEGDTIGLLILAYPHESVAELAEKLKSAASVRVEPRSGGRVYSQGQVLDPSMRLSSSGLRALDRFDLRWSDD